jgi:hypothetical protein
VTPAMQLAATSSCATPVLPPRGFLYPYSWLRNWNIVIQLFVHFLNISLVFFHFSSPLFSRVSLITRVFSTLPLGAKICTKLRKGKDCLLSVSPPWQNYKKALVVFVPEFGIYLVLGLPFLALLFAVREITQHREKFLTCKICNYSQCKTEFPCSLIHCSLN